jgi:sulfite exporter TauE/SafE
MWWLSAFLVGFLGSFHCIGMCGPVAMALPINAASTAHVVFGRLVYNFGRIVTYGTLGIIAGLFGRTFAMAGFQQDMAIIVGVIVLIFAFIPLLFKRTFHPESVLYRITGSIKNIFRQLFGKRGNLALFFLGIANGLLPCGFVYLALAAAATSGHTTDGIIYMTMFGLGTLPAMLSISLATSIFSPSVRRIISSWTPYVAIAVAIFLIYRGLAIEPATCCRP